MHDASTVCCMHGPAVDGSIKGWNSESEYWYTFSMINRTEHDSQVVRINVVFINDCGTPNFRRVHRGACCVSVCLGGQQSYAI